MASQAWTKEEVALLREHTQRGFTSAEIALVLGRTNKAIRRKREKLNIRAKVQPSQFVLDPPATLKADRALLLFDLHAPLHHTGWVNRVLDLALSWGCDGVGIGGDLVDYSSICYWGRSIGIEYDDELESAQQIVRVLEDGFRQRVLCGGNHEMRLVRALKHARRLQDVMDDFVSNDPATVTTNRQWFWLESGGKRFRVVHPRNYSRIPARTAQALASKYDCHIIAGHNHLWGMTRDVSGKHWTIDAGCCLDAKRIGYLEEEMSTNPMAVLGAVIVIMGTPVLLGQHNIEMYEGVKWQAENRS